MGQYQPSGLWDTEAKVHDPWRPPEQDSDQEVGHSPHFGSSLQQQTDEHVPDTASPPCLIRQRGVQGHVAC